MKNQLAEMQHPLMEALALQEHIEHLKSELASAEVKYNQIVLHCKENSITSQDGFAMRTKQFTRRTIDPELFARTFPEENKLLVARHAAFIGSELDKLASSKILPSIRIEDAKELVGNTVLDKACLITVSEKITIVKEKE
jgi:hypothetical protein